MARTLILQVGADNDNQLRLHSPVLVAIREAIQDDIIPLGTPFTDTNGEIQEYIK